ncbi:MAG: M48 family metallopeptidase [Clostridia bacterium]|nr:M48 family metallopeptidase [Clostridia bacterium]
MIEYELRRSSRRTLSLEVNREAKLVVHAPRSMPLAQIESFIASHLSWITKSQEKAKARMLPEPSESEIASLKEKARAILTEKTEYYAALMGVTYSHIGISSAKTRFGSCSKKGSINYSWRLMLFPEAAWDYVVVHELCHLTHFDHSKSFWQTVAKYLPDYKERQKLLK